MSLTFLQLQQLTSDWVDDPENGYFGLDLLKIRLNLAAKELQKRLISANKSYYAKCLETVTVSGQQPYAVPSDFLQILKLEIITQGSGVTAETKELEKITTWQKQLIPWRSGIPEAYYFQKDNIMLWPVPNSVKTLRLEYSYIIEDMVDDDDEPDAPEIFHEYIAVLATRDCLLKDRREILSISAKLGWYEELFKQVAQQRFADGNDRVTVTSGGYGDI